MKRFYILILILLVPIGALVLFITGVFRPAITTPTPVKLVLWTTIDEPKAYRTVLAEYKKVRPYITIDVQQVASDDYANKLKDAWARGKGPDIFEMPASWVGEFSKDFITPIPKSTKVFTYSSRKILFKTDVQIEDTVVPSITPAEVRKLFADVVADDMIGSDGKIYGLPLALDTLVLYYNKDLFRSANIAEPPATWAQLASLAPRISVADDNGKLLQSAIALGRGSNISHAADILSLLFLQDGMTMTTETGQAPIDDNRSSEGTNLGVNALAFYTSFASPTKSVYSWNADQPRSLEAFIRGKTAMYIGYNSDRDSIDNSGTINLGIAPMLHLQPDGRDALLSTGGNPTQVNFGNYKTLSVFQRTKNPQEAWNFVQFITKQESVAKLYLQATRRIGALRSILTIQADDPEIGIQAQQAISARSWYHGRDANAVDQAFVTMLDRVADGKSQPLEALTLARRQIEATIRRVAQ